MLAASGKDGGLCVIVYNQQVQDEPSEEEQIELTVEHFDALPVRFICRLDGEHANRGSCRDEMDVLTIPMHSRWTGCILLPVSRRRRLR